MKARILTAALAGFLGAMGTAHGDCGGSDDGAVAYYANFWEAVGSCSEDCTVSGMVDDLNGALDRIGVPITDRRIMYDTMLTVAPTARLSTLCSALDGVSERSVFLFTHGAVCDSIWPSGLITDTYAAEQTCLNAFNDLVSNLHLVPCYDPQTHEPNAAGEVDWDTDTTEVTNQVFYFIALTGSGVQKLARRLPTGGFVLGGFYCRSCLNETDWGVDASMEESMYCYNFDHSMCDACHDLAFVYSVLGCNMYNTSPCERSNDTDDVFEMGLLCPGVGDSIDLTDLQLRGHRRNRLRCGRSCQIISGRWLHTSAYDGHVRMALVSEDSASTYFVIADGDTASQFAGRGSDGYGRLRCYSVPVASSVNSFTCLEVDGVGRKTYSDPFTWQGESGSWEDLEPLDNMTMEEVEAQPWPPWEPDPWGETDPRWTWMAACSTWADTTAHHWETLENGVSELVFDSLRTECTGCADVVFYVHRAIGDEGLVALNIGYQMASDFPTLKFRTFFSMSSLPDILLVRELLRMVITANDEHNGQYGTHFPVDPGPTLVLVGTGDGLTMPIAFPDPPIHACNAGNCFSYNLYADVFPAGNEDGLPDCPVMVVPATTVDQAITMLCHASEWNHGEHVNDAGRGVFLLDDHDPGINARNHVLDGPMLRIRDMYSYGPTPGLEAGPLMLTQDYYHSPPQYPWPGYAALEGVLAEGVRDIWAYGFVTWAHVLPFLDYIYFRDGYQLDTNQVIMVFAPSCDTGGGGYSVSPPAIWSRLLLQDPGKTRAAGFLGQKNSDWDGSHLEFAQVFRNELGNSPEGTTFDIITHNAVRTIQEQLPHYGKGVVWLGALTKMRGTFGASSAVDGERGDAAAPGGELRATCRAGQADLCFRLARDAEIGLNVYDVSGRLVSRVKNGALGAGDYTYTWFMTDTRGRPVDSGIYFARLKIGSSGEGAQHARIWVAR